jgi:hypothetical protein
VTKYSLPKWHSLFTLEHETGYICASITRIRRAFRSAVLRGRRGYRSQDHQTSRSFVKTNKDCLRSRVSRARLDFQMVVPNGGSKWWFQMVVPNGGSKWWFQMVVANDGSKRWLQTMAPNDGSKRWLHRDGSARMRRAKLISEAGKRGPRTR